MCTADERESKCSSVTQSEHCKDKRNSNRIWQKFKSDFLLGRNDQQQHKQQQHQCVSLVFYDRLPRFSFPCSCWWYVGQQSTMLVEFYELYFKMTNYVTSKMHITISWRVFRLSFKFLVNILFVLCNYYSVIMINPGKKLRNRS